MASLAVHVGITPAVADDGERVLIVWAVTPAGHVLSLSIFPVNDEEGSE